MIATKANAVSVSHESKMGKYSGKGISFSSVFRNRVEI